MSRGKLYSFIQKTLELNTGIKLSSILMWQFVTMVLQCLRNVSHGLSSSNSSMGHDCKSTVGLIICWFRYRRYLMFPARWKEMYLYRPRQSAKMSLGNIGMLCTPTQHTAHVSVLSLTLTRGRYFSSVLTYSTYFYQCIVIDSLCSLNYVILIQCIIIPTPASISDGSSLPSSSCLFQQGHVFPSLVGRHPPSHEKAWGCQGDWQVGGACWRIRRHIPLGSGTVVGAFPVHTHTLLMEFLPGGRKRIKL